ncbi:bleomycin resistance protein [Sphingobacterium sp. HJSM2_6]
MLLSVCPKLPMSDVKVTRDFYSQKLGFIQLSPDYPNYLILHKNQIEIHFFEFKNLDPAQNYGQIYIRCQDIKSIYEDFMAKQVSIHPNGNLSRKPWGITEFSILDPDLNLLTFGE